MCKIGGLCHFPGWNIQTQKYISQQLDNICTGHIEMFWLLDYRCLVDNVTDLL